MLQTKFLHFLTRIHITHYLTFLFFSSFKIILEHFMGIIRVMDFNVHLIRFLRRTNVNV